MAKRIIEIEEEITRTYRVEVTDEIAHDILKYNDITAILSNEADGKTLSQLSKYHSRGRLIDNSTEISYALMFDDDECDYRRAQELYYDI